MHRNKIQPKKVFLFFLFHIKLEREWREKKERLSTK